MRVLSIEIKVRHCKAFVQQLLDLTFAWFLFCLLTSRKEGEEEEPLFAVELNEWCPLKLQKKSKFTLPLVCQFLYV